MTSNKEKSDPSKGRGFCKNLSQLQVKVACRLSSKIFKLLYMINPTSTAGSPHQTGCIISIVSLLSNKTNISVSSWQYGHYFICFLFPRLLYLHTPSVLELIYINVTKPVEVTQITRSAIDKKWKSVFVLVQPRQLFLHYV